MEAVLNQTKRAFCAQKGLRALLMGIKLLFARSR